MVIALETPQGWFQLPPDLHDEAATVLDREILSLRMMMAFDTGWTGIIFERAGATWMLYTSTQHVVDIRSWHRRGGAKHHDR